MGISYHEKRGFWVLENGGMAYVMGVDADLNLHHLYWGKPLPYPGDYPVPVLPEEYGFDSPLQRIKEEYPPWGGMRFKEGALKVFYSNGVRDLLLHYDSFHLTKEELQISLVDPVFDVQVHLYYQLHPTLPILKRWIQIQNHTPGDLMIHRIYSACLHLPRLKQYRLTYLSGAWVGETQLTQTQLTPGKKLLESRRGAVGHRFNPFFAIDDGRAQEDWGHVYYGALAYSGSFCLLFEQEEGLQVLGGINDFDFSLSLGPGESFTTPSFILGFSQSGFEEMSQHLHQYQWQNLIPRRKKPLPVLYNSWEVEGFGVTEKKQKELAQKAQELGVEVFVLDDGWFHRRDSDQRGLGDWFVDDKKFPAGLEPLISYVRDLGMGFGLWVEPEMVNPHSLLFKAHPHWVYQFPSRSSSLYRNQLLLNLGLEPVRSFIKKTLDTLIGRYQLDFLKWDMNRHFSEPGAMELPEKHQQEVWYRHVEGLYEILDFIQRRYPHLIIEACSGGGGRVDLGILPYIHQFWVSDNTDPWARLRIQEGFSRVYAPRTMGCWVTDSPHWLTQRVTPMDYRFHVAMMGSLGLGGDLTSWDEKEQELAKEKVAQYKQYRELIQGGYIHWLLSPREGPLTAVQYRSRDQQSALVFLFLLGEHFGPHTTRIRLRGLQEDWLYQVEGGEILSGGALMERGLSVSLHGDFSSALLPVTRVLTPLE